jgi:hypothetical protein
MRKKKIPLFFILITLFWATLACSLTDQNKSVGAVMAIATAPTQTATQTATLQPSVTATNGPACVVRTGVTGGRVNLRACAGLGCAVVAVLADGDSLAVISGGDWIQVQTADGLTGYVNSKYCQRR